MKSSKDTINVNLLTPASLNVLFFSGLCAILFWVVDKSGYGFRIGLIWGGVFGGLFYWVSRKVNQFVGDGSAGLITNGFSGTVSGTMASFATHLVFGINLHAFIIGVFGDMSAGVSQIAFYVMAEGAFLGGGFGVFQSLLMGKLNRWLYHQFNKGHEQERPEPKKMLKGRELESNQKKFEKIQL